MEARLERASPELRVSENNKTFVLPVREKRIKLYKYTSSQNNVSF